MNGLEDRKMNLDKYGLMDRSKEDLVILVKILMDTLTEEERMEFVSKWLNPQEALDESGEPEGSSFIDEVISFCQECLDGNYSLDFDLELDYDYYHEEDDWHDFSGSEWAEQFTKFLKLSVMYSRKGDYDIAYDALDLLMDCLLEAESDENLLSTEVPMDAIELDWDEVFGAYLSSISHHFKDPREAAEEAIEVWMDFREKCTDSILDNFSDIMSIEEAIRKNIADNTGYWFIQHELYGLLKLFYSRLGLEFDEVRTAKSLVSSNPNFLSDVAQGDMRRERWEEAVETIREALDVVTDDQLIFGLNGNLADCFGRLGRFNEAYEIAVELFFKKESHDMYLRARNFAIEIDHLDTFIDSMEKHILSSRRVGTIYTLLRILSYEGRTLKLIETAMKSQGYERHDFLKFASKSLIYRALGAKEIPYPDLKEFLRSIEHQQIAGIVDMRRTPKDSEDEQFLLDRAVGILKQMVQFHIDETKRKSYAIAADYCAVIRDIYLYRNEEDEFDKYNKDVLDRNGRRPALKDEMNKRIKR